MARHGGNLFALAQNSGLSRETILDFSANLNPLGPPEQLRPLISRAVETVLHYPDPDNTALTALLAQRHQVAPDRVVVGNGASELLFALPAVLNLTRALIPVPSYVDYVVASERAHLSVRRLLLPPETGFQLSLEALVGELEGDELVVLGQPNNPTGTVLDADALATVIAAHPTTFFLVDESFADFVVDLRSLAGEVLPNFAVLRSLTKTYAIPGLRLGYVVSTPEVAGKLRGHLPTWSVNSLAQALGEAFLGDEDYLRRTQETVPRLREGLAARLRSLPELHVYPSAANFLLVRCDRPGLEVHSLAQQLLQQGLAIRVCDNYEGLGPGHFRVAVRDEADNERLADALAVLLGQPPSRPRRRHTPALMLQGTCSNAGKSILTTALCRIFLQDGLSVAPFKAQNMSLNSFVTPDGGEIGRAQALQAQACRLEPDVRMNPVLLKPSSDTGSQVIVRGKPVGNMSVGEYFRYKPEAFGHVCDCYDSLAREHDVIVLEGAGSPGEVNLKRHDIVNMAMARYAAAPVLLVGDIDRGGVFASFVGTLEVMAEWERRLVSGFIVNKFRGKAELLQDAFDYVLRHVGKPVLGTIPYLHDLNLPEEDSVSFKSTATSVPPRSGDALDIAVCDLPHISNFTDLDALRLEPDVRVRVVRSAGELGTPAACIIPGSKNTLGDMEYLRQTGLAGRLLALAAAGDTVIVGVCGGFQMLGTAVHDPHHLESDKGSVPGLGLLAVETTFEADKLLQRADGVHLASGERVFGYEIHHGRTETASLPVWLQRADGSALGVASVDGRVWGTYLHGVFDADGFRRWFVNDLRCRQGWLPLAGAAAHYDLEPALDRLAEVVRGALAVPALYRMMGL